MSLRQELIDEQKTRFAGISVANGYNLDIQTVAEWQQTPLEDSKLPAILISDPDDAKRPDDPNSGKHTWDQLMIVDVVLNEAAQTAENARLAIADIKKAVAVDLTWGSRARRTEEVTDTLRLDKTGNRVAGVQIKYKIVTSRKPFHT